MAVTTGVELVAELTAQLDRPDPADWRDRYTPEQAVGYAAELLDLEDQLDLGWAPWRKRKPFIALPHDKVAWIKLRLSRRDLILNGRGAWGLGLTRRASDGLPMVFVVRPPRDPEHISPAYRALTTAPLLSQRLGIPVALVEELLVRLPYTVRDVRSWLVGERDRIASAPLQAASAPLPDQLPEVA
jgi:hypothetical protein